ncbi:unnamed protein product, partial [Choristocarpus tenellus]
KRPTPPLFSFPPGQRVGQTRAEEKIEEVLPVQQRLVKYLSDDRVFGVQVLCSIYFLLTMVAHACGNAVSGSFQSALVAVMIKQWGTVLGRMQRVLVPHLLYEPQRW